MKALFLLAALLGADMVGCGDAVSATASITYKAVPPGQTTVKGYPQYLSCTGTY